MKIKDTYRHKGLRKKLVEELKQKGIQDERILAAIGKIPRHLFLDLAFEEWAYKDVAFPIGEGQTISQPYTVAFQTQLMDITEGEKVLEIGTGSGYQACVLVEMGAKVYSVERQEALFNRTNEFLRELGYSQIRTFLSDGTLGLDKFAPYDKILVTAGISKVPETLLDQLKIGGYLVIPVGSSETQEMLRVQRISDRKFKKESFGAFQFVPFLKGLNKS